MTMMSVEVLAVRFELGEDGANRGYASGPAVNGGVAFVEDGMAEIVGRLAYGVAHWWSVGTAVQAQEATEGPAV
jgi:hypothetical protein